MPLSLQLTLIGWAASLFGGFIFGKVNDGETRRMPRWARLLSSVFLTVAAWIWWATTTGRIEENYTLPVAFGMSMGLIGDLLMAEVIFPKLGVMGGLIAFGLGSAAYTVAIMRFGDSFGANNPNTRIVAGLIGAAIGALCWWLAVYMPSKNSPGDHRLSWIALPYAILLSQTAAAAAALNLQQPTFGPLAMGTILFIVSDLLIAVRMFGKVSFYLIDDLIWLLYGPAQALIVYAVFYGFWTWNLNLS